MTLKITTLVENTQGEHLALRAEHGLSFHVQADSFSFLFDTGQSDAILHNAALLNINLGEVEKVVVSHGHYDHSGGVRPLFNRAHSFDLIVHQDFFTPKYGRRDHDYAFLGNDFNARDLPTHGCGLLSVEQETLEIYPGVHVISSFKRSHPEETHNPRFCIPRTDGMVTDCFDDEILVAIDTPRGLIVLLGCSHPGIMNMLDTVQDRLQRPIHTVLGGSHLVEADEDRLRTTIDYIQDHEISCIGVSHCTGERATALLEEVDPRFFHNHTGSTLIRE